jgi:hypothetical protein
MGAAIGGRNVNQTGANALFQGGVSAAKTVQGPASYSPTAGLFSGLGNYAAQGVPSLTDLYKQYQQGQQNYTPPGYTPAAAYDPTLELY